eukprot:CAMPEP_0115696200 /NCGR_PEP_ID=MMETSP0272-20121206/65157_1 /TAXON_ID=71861 /ORGANISM="Scrippsiella trochoidea, Strain CCMP3099" /LENGTH=898 /DNA_ID=CAMNT_0003136419 /DNA_START=149 /DNA_END=2843 /DNA_ORIENTATION=-
MTFHQLLPDADDEPTNSQVPTIAEPQVYCSGHNASEFCVEVSESLCTEEDGRCSTEKCRCEDPSWHRQELQTLSGAQCFSCVPPATLCTTSGDMCTSGPCECADPSHVKVLASAAFEGDAPEDNTTLSEGDGQQAPCFRCQPLRSRDSEASTLATFVLFVIVGLAGGCCVRRLRDPMAAASSTGTGGRAKLRRQTDSPRPWSERLAEELEDTLEALYDIFVENPLALVRWARPHLRQVGKYLGNALDACDMALEPCYCAVDAVQAAVWDQVVIQHERLVAAVAWTSQHCSDMAQAVSRFWQNLKGNSSSSAMPAKGKSARRSRNSPAAGMAGEFETASTFPPGGKAKAQENIERPFVERTPSSQDEGVIADESTKSGDSNAWEPLVGTQANTTQLTVPEEWMRRLINPTSPAAAPTRDTPSQIMARANTPAQTRAQRKLQQRREALAQRGAAVKASKSTRRKTSGANKSEGAPATAIIAPESTPTMQTDELEVAREVPPSVEATNAIVTPPVAEVEELADPAEIVETEKQDGGWDAAPTEELENANDDDCEDMAGAKETEGAGQEEDEEEHPNFVSERDETEADMVRREEAQDQHEHEPAHENEHEQATYVFDAEKLLGEVVHGLFLIADKSGTPSASTKSRSKIAKNATNNAKRVEEPEVEERNVEKPKSEEPRLSKPIPPSDAQPAQEQQSKISFLETVRAQDKRGGQNRQPQVGQAALSVQQVAARASSPAAVVVPKEFRPAIGGTPATAKHGPAKPPIAAHAPSATAAPALPPMRKAPGAAVAAAAAAAAPQLLPAGPGMVRRVPVAKALPGGASPPKSAQEVGKPRVWAQVVASWAKAGREDDEEEKPKVVSTLGAEAPEFIPLSMMQQPFEELRPSKQGRQKKASRGAGRGG